MRIAVVDTERGEYYYIHASPEWCKRHDNGALISLGLKMPEELSRRAFARVKREKISHAEWNHSGCLSECKRRGDSNCRW